MFDLVVNFFLIAISVWLLAVTFYLYKIYNHYQRLVKGTGKENLSEILDKVLTEQIENKKYLQELKTQVATLKNDITYYVQKVGLLRFNPFGDTGGDQSFILALLDGNDTGVVLSSLFSRGTTRWFAKSVIEGKGVDHDLSEEEKKAIKQAVNVNRRK